MKPHPSSLKPQASPLLLAAFLCIHLWLIPLAHAQNDPIPPNVQSAVDRGLDYLAQHQAANGMFAAPANGGPSTAVTSLAAMAFLARGHVPGQGPYGDTLNKTIDWVLAQQKPSGLISAGSHAMYDHGISTVMLCEVYAMVDEARQKKIEAAVAKAVKVILDAQKIPKDGGNKGGWRYQPTSSDSDISVTGWQLMALRGAANIGAAVPKQAIDEGVAYLRHLASPTGGFGYMGSSDVSPARTGTGVTALELLGQHNSRESLAGGDYLLLTPFGKNNNDANFRYYTIYYCSQAAYQLAGKYYEGIYRPIRDAAIATQRVDGSWPVGSSIETQGGDIYATAMSLLALEVPYRYLPLYQR